MPVERVGERLLIPIEAPRGDLVALRGHEARRRAHHEQREQARTEAGQPHRPEVTARRPGQTGEDERGRHPGEAAEQGRGVEAPGDPAAQDEPGGYAAGERYMPDELDEPDWYRPTDRGLEAKIGEKLAWLRRLDDEAAAARR